MANARALGARDRGFESHLPDHRPHVLGIGEALWDLLPDGPRLGGAPFNATVHLARLGHPALFLTAVGDDELGYRARDAAVMLGIDPSAIQVIPDAPTGTVDVHLDGAGTPRYEIRTPAAYEWIDVAAATRAVLDHRPAAVVLGTLAQRSPSVRAATRAVLDAVPEALVVYDANLRDGHWTPALVSELLQDADVLRCDADELAMIGAAPDDLLVTLGLRAVVVTRGADGAIGWSADGRVEVRAIPVEVVDTIGAGDAFTAGVTHALLAGRSLADALDEATRLAASVVGMSGALGVAARPPASAQDA